MPFYVRIEFKESNHFYYIKNQKCFNRLCIVQKFIIFQNYTFCLFNVLICTQISYYSVSSDPEFSCSRPCWSRCHKKI
ncbi:hypothetical protein C0J52_08039 [Blattella germanica]|nr:hypothetical protein C0J52_08039 [Blattella germanica]